jgi:hypothetical protein
VVPLLDGRSSNLDHLTAAGVPFVWRPVPGIRGAQLAAFSEGIAPGDSGAGAIDDLFQSPAHRFDCSETARIVPSLRATGTYARRSLGVPARTGGAFTHAGVRTSGRYDCHSTPLRSGKTQQAGTPPDCQGTPGVRLDLHTGCSGRMACGIDQAIALIGPNTGISTSLGLLDATGRPLAKAIAASGLSPRNGLVHSIAELEVWLDHGPLALDGAGWFGEGHWFVATGCDQNGINIRDSSGWDNHYLTWSHLYGEVGFSGWVVGVAG